MATLKKILRDKLRDNLIRFQDQRCPWDTFDVLRVVVHDPAKVTGIPEMIACSETPEKIVAICTLGGNHAGF